MVAIYEPLIILETTTHMPEVALQHFKRGNSLHIKGEYEKALQEYEAAIKAAPDSSEAHTNLGVIQERLGHHKLALKSFDKAVAFHSDSTEVHYNRGIVLASLKRYDDAYRAFDKALEIQPQNDKARENRKKVLELILKRLAKKGVISWVPNGKPKGYDGPITITPGPPISSYVIENRR